MPTRKKDILFLWQRVCLFFESMTCTLTIAVLVSLYAGVDNETINRIGVWYTASRVAFSLLYSYIESSPASYLRSVAWWSGNISCITGLILAGKKL